ncbi:hypothetical protein VE03_10744, partial [Pseudogymnoascus sp. 23342-1-I1]
MGLTRSNKAEYLLWLCVCAAEGGDGGVYPITPQVSATSLPTQRTVTEAEHIGRWLLFHLMFSTFIIHPPASAFPSSGHKAFWLFGPDWPNSGEIDIIEGVNNQATNIVTLHTAAGCAINNAGSLSDTTTVEANCNAKSGCS